MAQARNSVALVRAAQCGALYRGKNPCIWPYRYNVFRVIAA